MSRKRSEPWAPSASDAGAALKGAPGGRDVGWPSIEGALAVRPTVQKLAPARLQAALLLSKRLPDEPTLLSFGFAAVEGLRRVLELDRIALFLRSKSGTWLSGLVGTNQAGVVVDERSIRHAVDPDDETLWSDLILGRRAFELLDNAPLIAHSGEETRVIARGWFVKTPIVFGKEQLGLFYNDSALSKGAFDTEKQEILAAFASFFAPHLHVLRERSWPPRVLGLSPEVAECLELLAADLSASQSALARRLEISPHQLSRVFHQEMGVQLQTYRAELRLERFFRLVEAREDDSRPLSLLDLALESGFGSYSQFHRVFTARFGRSPKRYLTP